MFGPETEGQSAKCKDSPGKVNGVKKIKEIGLADTQHISTTFVERSDLTMRMSMRRFTRLTNAHSKKIEKLAFAVGLFFAYCNYRRVHSTIGTSPQ